MKHIINFFISFCFLFNVVFQTAHSQDYNEVYEESYYQSNTPYIPRNESPSLSIWDKTLITGTAASAGIAAGMIAGKLCARKGEKGSTGSSGYSGYSGAQGPAGTGINPIPLSRAALVVTFYSEQNNPFATGTFEGIVTFPDQSIRSVTGQIDATSDPVTIYISEPSQVGTYIFTYKVKSIGQAFDTPPIITVTNINTHAINVYNISPQAIVGSQESVVYYNEPNP